MSRSMASGRHSKSVECTTFPNEVSETALARVVADKMEAVLRGDTSSTEAKPEPIDLEAPAKAILEKVAHGG